MMTLLVVLMAQAAARGPMDIVVPNAITNLHNQYVLCQDKNFDARKVRDKKSFGEEVERAIHACGKQKTALMKQAETQLVSAPDFQDRTLRARAIADSFDGYDRVRRAMADR